MPPIYINTIKQISVQQPLTDEWFDTPVQYSENYVRAVDPDFKQYLAPNTARRLGKILKRALVVSQKAMEASGISNPDAIITGTGLGCIENTELFLDKLVREGEKLLNPTQFMQSTHNTISSLVAIEAKCHNYNTTYAHKGISFDCALQDAFLQMQSGKIQTALVGAHDEMTPQYFKFLQKAGYFPKLDMQQSNMRCETHDNHLKFDHFFAGETAVAMMLSTKKTENTLCEIKNVEEYYGNYHCGLLDCRQADDPRFHEKQGISAFAGMTEINPDFVMVGTNGVTENDDVYFENCRNLFPNIPLLHYKAVFGESYTSPAFAMYAAALCLKNGKIPEFLHYSVHHCGFDTQSIRKILCYNHFENKNHTFVLLSNV
jgi:3-oxoacyl-(acyl-carrier-protein) synthase